METNMDTNLGAKPSSWKADGKSEKLSLLVLAVCIATLVTILIVHPF